MKFNLFLPFKCKSQLKIILLNSLEHGIHGTLIKWYLNLASKYKIKMYFFVGIKNPFSFTFMTIISDII